MILQCPICPHQCRISAGGRGFCQARSNRNGRIVSDSYGRVTSLALDPIEKKPLRHFHPGSLILSVGTFGCNLRCPFCQNHRISMAGPECETAFLSPPALAEKAVALLPAGNIGVAFTYNEPLVGYEYVRDASAAIREREMKTVLVTNGSICEQPLLELLPRIDAMNIDLKGFSEAFYRWIGGDLAVVKNTIRLAAARCHVEVTVLIIPGKNDSPQEMDRLARWLADIRRDIPLHISRCFPGYRCPDLSPASIRQIRDLAAVAAAHLTCVHTGNC